MDIIAESNKEFLTVDCTNSPSDTWIVLTWLRVRTLGNHNGALSDREGLIQNGCLLPFLELNPPMYS